jgi:plasmid stability protein
MRDLLLLLIHVLAVLARLAGPGGVRGLVAENVLLKQQLLVLGRARHRAQNLTPLERVVLGLCCPSSETIRRGNQSVRRRDVEVYGMLSLTSSANRCSQMPVVTVRKLPEETHRALKLRAAQHGRSTEAEIRAILEEAVRPKVRVKIGSELAAFGQRLGGLDLNVSRDQTPTEPADFE